MQITRVTLSGEVCPHAVTTTLYTYRKFIAAILSKPCHGLLPLQVVVHTPAVCCMLQITRHPWFAEGLPASATTMNDGYVKLPRSCPQSEEEIRHIAARAVAADHACGWSGSNLARLSAETPCC